MIWEDQLIDASNVLDMSPAMAGTFISLVVTIVVILGVLISTRGRGAQYTVPISALFCMIMFTFIGWMATWTGSVIGIVLALLIANTFSSRY